MVEETVEAFILAIRCIRILWMWTLKLVSLYPLRTQQLRLRQNRLHRRFLKVRRVAGFVQYALHHHLDLGADAEGLNEGAVVVVQVFTDEQRCQQKFFTLRLGSGVERCG